MKSKLHTAATVCYIITAVLFILLFLYMTVFEKADIFEARNTDAYTVVQNCSSENITDENAPVGIRRVFSWTLDDIGTDECSLVFYTVHHYAEVYFDDELMYSMMPGESNRISSSVSSNWVTIPVYREDIGKEVRVILTPVYNSAKDRNIEFYLDSYSSIILRQMKSDTPQIVLSGLCILLGLAITVFQVYLIAKKRFEKWDIFYLGNFLIILGLWRITDTRFSPLLFSNNTLVLGYVSIGMLFIGTIPLLLFLNERFARYKVNTPFLAISLVSSCVAVCVLLCQILGIAEFRQTLILSHLLIIATVISALITVVLQMRKKSTERAKSSWKFVLLLSVGAFLDIAFFYLNRSSSGIIYTIVAFLIYASILFAENMLDIQRRAYNDGQTGLYNRSRWEQLMKSKELPSEPIGIIMIDLNRLKYTNDTMGHEAGDKMILRFSNILRYSIPHSNTICRWGGDEFAIMVTDADQEKMERYLSGIAAEVSKHNDSGEKPEIYYAAGYVLSTEFPEFNLKELFEIADERMYQNKQTWYAEVLHTAH